MKTLPNKFISVKEFAKLAGVSSQSVYKKLNNKLQTYSTVVDNKKVIDTTALWEVYGIEEFNPNSTKFATNSTNDSTKVERVESNSLNQELIQMLRKELEEKNKQIERLQQSLDNEQRLHAMEKQKVLELQGQVAEQQEKKEQEPKRQRWSWFKK